MVATFRDQIAENKRKTATLVAVFCLFVAVVAMVITLGVLAYTGAADVSHLNWAEALGVGVVAGVVAFIISLVGYYAGDDMVLAVSGAHPITHDEDPELFNVVEEMAIAAGVPMPKVYLIHDPAPNAFATGRDPQHASIAITTGLRQILTRDELQGVVAHEMSHVRNYDIRLMLMLAVLVGTVVMLCDLFWQVLRFGSLSRGSRDRDSKDGGSGGGLIVVVLIVLAVLMAIIAPILAHLIQLAVSRQREYLADATAVQLTRYPQGLASALQKIDADPHELATANRGTAHLYIVNPVKRFENLADTAFASHPPIKDRIQRLMALTHEERPST